MTIIALTSLLVVGATAASILGRASVPSAGPAMTSGPAMASSMADGPVSNRESKKDKLAVIIAAQASLEPATDTIPATPLRQAFASSALADIEMPKAADPKAMDPVALPKPKVASKPVPRRRKNPTRCSATCRSPASRIA